MEEVIDEGTPTAGFTARADPARRLLSLRAWGFWDESLCRKYSAVMKRLVIKMSGPDWFFLADNSDFPPQSPMVQKAMAELMVLAPTMGLKRTAALVSKSLVQLQLQRLADENKLPGLAFFQDESLARKWLKDG